MEKILAAVAATAIVIVAAGVFWFFYGKYKRKIDENSANEMQNLEMRQIQKENERRANLKRDS